LALVVSPLETRRRSLSRRIGIDLELQAAGPGVSLRVGSRAWVGASFIGGQLSTEAHFTDFHTDFAFGALGEVTYAIVVTRSGECGGLPARLLDHRRRLHEHGIPLSALARLPVLLTTTPRRR
jgi:hypothetical protein